MSGLKGLWCFYIAKERDNAQRAQVLTPPAPSLLPFTPSLSPLLPLYTTTCLVKHSPAQQHARFLSHKYTHSHTGTHTRMPASCCPITTPCGPFGFCLCLMSVGSPGHSSAGPLLCSAGWNWPGPNATFYTEQSDAQLWFLSVMFAYNKFATAKVITRKATVTVFFNINVNIL